MHLVATNIIIWIRTLIKESLEEIEEYEVEKTRHEAMVSLSGSLRVTQGHHSTVGNIGS